MSKLQKNIFSNHLGLPAREMARIAYCMLRNGKWKEKQIISQWFIKGTEKPSHSIIGGDADSDSTGWELPARLPDGKGKGIPLDTQEKRGSGGQYIAFIPSLDLVVVRHTGGSRLKWEWQTYLRKTIEAVLII